MTTPLRRSLLITLAVLLLVSACRSEPTEPDISTGTDVTPTSSEPPVGTPERFHQAIQTDPEFVSVAPINRDDPRWSGSSLYLIGLRFCSALRVRNAVPAVDPSDVRKRFVAAVQDLADTKLQGLVSTGTPGSTGVPIPEDPSVEISDPTGRLADAIGRVAVLTLCPDQPTGLE